MTRLLISVRNEHEARLAIDAGADLIDVKEPRFGSLGAASMDTVQAVVAAVNGRVPVSVALGELCGDAAENTLRLARISHRIVVNYAKIGLAGAAKLADWPERWQSALTPLSVNTARVAVVYADWQNCDAPAPLLVLTEAAALGASVMLIDTYDKSQPGLLRQWKLAEIDSLLNAARQLGITTVLAGGLKFSDLTRLLPLEPDYVAVRGGVCHSTRIGELSQDLVRQWSSAVHSPIQRRQAI
ncbi:MAG: (5-formylfuran-3-yl)methyl phosphate synthase [Planctomycetota bacterium]|nr:(5-formylfuran-3-yl)methyl phosphate synthase [Planctomycetota bacterium]